MSCKWAILATGSLPDRARDGRRETDVPRMNKDKTVLQRIILLQYRFYSEPDVSVSPCCFAHAVKIFSAIFEADHSCISAARSIASFVEGGIRTVMTAVFFSLNEIPPLT